MSLSIFPLVPSSSKPRVVVNDTSSGIAYCQSRVKRGLDIVGAIVGLILLMPVFLLACIVVRFVDHVPPIFRQERFGYGGKPFTILKLRTLPIIEKANDTNAEKIQRKPEYATTRTGRFWRVHSVDEIIQFWLVLKGEMSLIGHRSFPVYYVPHLAEMPGMTPAGIENYLNIISQYKPGMTALSAINGRGNLTLQEKIAFDLDYARTASFKNDVVILLKTVVAVLQCEGAK